MTQHMRMSHATALAASLSHCHQSYRLKLITMEIGFRTVS